MSFAAAEGDRRTANLIMIGQIVEIDGGTGRARVQVGELTTPMIPVAVQRAQGMVTWWMPAEGEQVIVLAPSGDVARAVITQSILKSNAPSSDAGEPFMELNGGRLVIHGNLKVDGDLEVTGNVEIGGDGHIVGTLVVDTDVEIAGISFNTHRHRDVASGNSTSGEPV